MKSKQSGFTLVEIAIVLVIVGLLLGGVLKGQELITSSRAKALFADRAAIQTAFNTYNDRFRAVPGDDGAAAVRFSGLACGVAGAGASAINSGAGGGCTNGDGNGVIAGQGGQGGTAAAGPVAVLAANPAAGGASENYKLWQHLRAAQLIKTEGSQSDVVGGVNAIFQPPRNASNGRIAVNTTRPYFGQQDSALYFLTSNVPGNVATALDAANDDGFTNRGGLRAANNGTLAAPNSDATGTIYAPAAAFIISTNLL